jgi:hypothetical protein
MPFARADAQAVHKRVACASLPFAPVADLLHQHASLQRIANGTATEDTRRNKTQRKKEKQ